MQKKNQIQKNAHPKIILVMILVSSMFHVYASDGWIKKEYKRKPSNYKNRLYHSNLVLEGKVYYGFIARHHVGMEIYNSHFPSFELSLSKATYGKKFWEQMFNYPWIGISWWYSNLGSSDYLGTVNAIFPYLNFPLVETDRVKIGFRLGAGVGYHNKKFERLDNYKHLSIGTHLNFAGNLMLDFRWHPSERLVVTSGISLTHFSNGAVKLPNYGLNIPGISVGIGYWLQKANKPIHRPLYSPVKPAELDMHRIIQFDITGNVGFKNMEAVFGGRYMVFSVFGNIFKPVSYKSKFGIGFDVSYDASDKLILERSNMIVTNQLSMIKTGFSFAYELEVGRLSFDLNYGFYLSGIDKSDGTVYHKLSMRYDITKHIFANITLKTHWGKADYIGWGVGYKVKWLY